MSEGGFLGAAGPLEIFGESAFVAEEELFFIICSAGSDICLLRISKLLDRQDTGIRTSPDERASQTEQRVSQVLHRFGKTPAVKHIHASKNAHRRSEQPHVPNKGALDDHSGDFLACVIDHQ